MAVTQVTNRWAWNINSFPVWGRVGFCGVFSGLSNLIFVPSPRSSVLFQPDVLLGLTACETTPPVLTFGMWTRWIYLSVDLEKNALLIAVDPSTWRHDQFRHNEIWWPFSNSIYNLWSTAPMGIFKIHSLAWKFCCLKIPMNWHSDWKDSWQTCWNAIIMKSQTFCWPFEYLWGRCSLHAEAGAVGLRLNSSSSTHPLSDLEQIAPSELTVLWC